MQIVLVFSFSFFIAILIGYIKGKNYSEMFHLGHWSLHQSLTGYTVVVYLYVGLYVKLVVQSHSKY